MPYRRPLEPNSLYNLATTFDITSGIDNLRPLLAYKEKHPETFPKKRDDGWGLKVREREAEETVIFVSAQVSFNFNIKLAIVGRAGAAGGVLLPRHLVGDLAVEHIRRPRHQRQRHHREVRR